MGACGARDRGACISMGDEEPDESRANYADANVGAPTPVGLFPNGATPEGICDTAGNVWEWVADWYGESGREKQRNPKGPPTGQYRMLRGGSWNVNASCLRAAFRHWDAPQDRYYSIGFRCGREVSVP